MNTHGAALLPHANGERIESSSPDYFGDDGQAEAFFLAQLFNYRTCNVLSYLETLSPPGAPAIDLIVPSMVDFDYWLTGGDNHATETSLVDQIRVMEQIAIVSGGRVHGFAPFDPLRHIVTKGASFDMVTDAAVMKQGCVGVKIYPPMGFAAYGNKYVKPNPGQAAQGCLLTHTGPTSVSGSTMPYPSSSTGDCKYDVPVMAHTNVPRRPDR